MSTMVSALGSIELPMRKPSKDNDAAAAVGRPDMVLEWRTVPPKPHSNLTSMGRPKKP